MPPLLRFEWDDSKDRTNRKKHGISFQEAMTVFTDEHALLIDDPEHSDQEDRFILLGLSSSLKMLVVCHCYRGREGIIRIISARRANSRERRMYQEGWVE